MLSIQGLGASTAVVTTAGAWPPPLSACFAPHAARPSASIATSTQRGRESETVNRKAAASMAALVIPSSSASIVRPRSLTRNVSTQCLSARAPEPAAVGCGRTAESTPAAGNKVNSISSQKSSTKAIAAACRVTSALSAPLAGSRIPGLRQPGLLDAEGRDARGDLGVVDLGRRASRVMTTEMPMLEPTFRTRLNNPAASVRCPAGRVE